jgi:hypothetical protein
MTPSEAAHAGEREENTYKKQQQGKV